MRQTRYCDCAPVSYCNYPPSVRSREIFFWMLSPRCDTKQTACTDRLVADTGCDANRCIDCGRIDLRDPCECC